MKFQQAQLDNGLQIVAEVNPTASSLATGFFVRTGSRDETPAVSGVSHFLEHMVFKGTPRRTALDVNLEFDRLGAQYNASTSEENTLYFAAVLPDFQDDCLDVLCDILRPSLRQEDFDVEKEVIQEEIAMYEDMPTFRLHEMLMSMHFSGHGLGNLILGTTQSIRDLKRQDMQTYFDRRYSPTNVTLVAAGNLDFDRLVAKADQMCSHWKPFTADRPLEPHAGGGQRRCVVDEKLTRQNLGLMSPAPSQQSEERLAARLAAEVLGDTSGSRLYYALIETALADEAHVVHQAMDGAGAMMTFASTAPQRAGQVIETILREFHTFFQTGPTDTELQAAKNKIASHATIQAELPMGRLLSVGSDWLYRKEYQPIDEQIEELFAVTGRDVLETVRRCRLTEASLITLGPTEVKLP